MPQGGQSLEPWSPEIFADGARSPDDLDAWSPEYLITVKPGAPNEMLWSPGAPIFLSWPGSPGTPHIIRLVFTGDGIRVGVVSGVGTIPVSSDSAYDSDPVKTRLLES